MRHFALSMTLALGLVALPAAAQSESGSEIPAGQASGTESHALAPLAAETASPQTIAVDVNGLVCDFCAQALTKVFAKRAEVDAVEVDLKAKVVALKMKPGADLSDADITALIANAGYNVVAIRREGA